MRSILLSALIAAFLAGFVGCGGSEEEGQPPAKPAAQTPEPGPAPPATPPVEPAGQPTTPPVEPAGQPTQPAEPEESLDTSFISDDFVAAVIVHPKRISKSPILAPLLAHEQVVPQLQAFQQMGLDPLGVERLVLLIPAPAEVKAAPGVAPPPGPAEPFGAILSFAEPVDGKKLLMVVRTLIMAGAEGELIEVAHGTKTYYKFNETLPVVAHIADEKTIIVADEPTLKKMLSAGGAKSPLIDRLRQIDLDNDLIVVFDLGPVRERIKAGIAAGKAEIPQPLAPFAALPDLLKTVTLLVTLDGDQLFTLVLESNDAQGAATVEELAKGGHAMAKQMFDAQRKQMPEEASEALAPLIGLADQVLGGINIARNNVRVVLSLKKPETLDQVGPTLVMQALEKLRKGLQAGKEAAGPPMDPIMGNNLKQIALAMHAYHEDNGSFPPAAVRDAQGKPTLSWRVALLPYLGKGRMYKVFRQNEPWDSQHNTMAIKHVPDVFCAPGREKDGKTPVMLFVGPGTAFAGEKGPKMAEITDGASATIMLVAAGAEKAVPWTKPEDLVFDPDDPAAALGQLAGAGFAAAFFDGSVRMVPLGAGPEALKDLITPAGDKPAQLPMDTGVDKPPEPLDSDPF